MPIDPFPRRHLLVLAACFEGGLGVLAWLLGLLLRQIPWGNFHWQVGDAALGLAASVPLLFLFVACIRWPVGPLARIKEFSEEILRPLFSRCTVPDLALISTLAGIGEEMLFRGVLQGFLSRWLNPWLGLAAASTIFGLLHLITPTYAVLATVMGAYLGWVWMESQNLLVVIVAHSLYDFLALVYLVRLPGASQESGVRNQESGLSRPTPDS